MKSIAHRVILCSGWPRRLVAMSSGAIGALAMAPIDFLPALAVSMTAATWLLDGAAEGTRLSSLRSAAAAGWWWGFGYFLAGLWWLGSAFLLEPERWAWALPLGVIALPAGLALFPALGFALARLLWSPGSGRILALAAALGLSEWLRGHILSGFPWNTFGMTLGDIGVLGQAASIIGTEGLTIVAIAITAAPAALADGGKSRRVPRPVIAAALALAVLSGFGAWRLSVGHPGDVPGVKLRLMQPDLVQDAQFRLDNKDAILTDYLALSDRAKSPTERGLVDVTHLVWPETALPTLLARDPETLARLANALARHTTLIAGAFRVGEPPPGDRLPRYFNSIQVVDGSGQVVDSYDKIHLVPFGEYLPLQSLLERLGLGTMVRIPGQFEAGVVRKSLAVPGLPPAWPLVCYEAIFPGTSPPAGEPRPGLLLNVSNDSWFGLTAGPWQHLAHARMRTIEQGLPLVRAATTGVSAVIDSYGRIVAFLSPGVADVLDSSLPRSIAPPFYAIHGFLAVFFTWILAICGALLWRRPVS